MIQILFYARERDRFRVRVCEKRFRFVLIQILSVLHARRMKTWSEKFATFLANRGLSHLDAQLKLRVHPSVLHYWLHGTTPRKDMREKIEKWSDGEVPSEVEK